MQRGGSEQASDRLAMQAMERGGGRKGSKLYRMTWKHKTAISCQIGMHVHTKYLPPLLLCLFSDGSNERNRGTNPPPGVVEGEPKSWKLDARRPHCGLDSPSVCRTYPIHSEVPLCSSHVCHAASCRRPSRESPSPALLRR